MREASNIMYRPKPLLLIAIAVSSVNVAPAAADDRPNIVIILADDFGVGDIQAH